MSERRCAIAPCDTTHPGPDGVIGLTLEAAHPVTLHQAAAWPGEMEALGAHLAAAMDVSAPPPGQVAMADYGSRLFRAEPLVWHILNGEAPDIPADQGTVLDLSHGRALVRISGDQARAVMMRLTSIDLRDPAFPDGSVAATGAHHTPWTLFRRDDGAPAYEVLIMRSYAQDFWDQLQHLSAQFGCRAIAGAT